MKEPTIGGLIGGLVTIVLVTGAASQPVQVRLSDYAFEFPQYGYEISVTGETANFSDKLTADDYIIIRDDGYSLKTLIDRMGRKDRQQFITFFNEHCSRRLRERCAITASGDIELDEEMRMIFRVVTTQISNGGNVWSNARE